ncbi:hypothetical protein V493_05820 [Pseudogymnoascus sp. VKM F-4281 (FW-2241)]|nr:hypothetical protein V493_05820 [Pseudogymnoascus sp. VKM F-4281 (FW-2241)]
MASTTISDLTEVRLVRRKYRWPAAQLNFWLFIVLVSSSSVLGIFASFSSVQSQLGIGTPWYFTYNITTGALGIAFILLLLYLINTRALLPGIVILGSFILFILWLVGLIVISIELWGPQGDINGNCSLYVGGQESRGQSVETLAWLMQDSISTPRSPSYLTLVTSNPSGNTHKHAQPFTLLPIDSRRLLDTGMTRGVIADRATTRTRRAYIVSGAKAASDLTPSASID